MSREQLHTTNLPERQEGANPREGEAPSEVQKHPITLNARRLASILGLSEKSILFMAKEEGMPHFMIPRGRIRVFRFEPAEVLDWFRTKYGRNYPSSRRLHTIEFEPSRPVMSISAPNTIGRKWPAIT